MKIGDEGWVPGGNSDMQNLARDCARAALNALADNVTEKMVYAMRAPTYDDEKIEAAIRAAGEG